MEEKQREVKTLTEKYTLLNSQLQEKEETISEQTTGTFVILTTSVIYSFIQQPIRTVLTQKKLNYISHVYIYTYITGNRT